MRDRRELLEWLAYAHFTVGAMCALVSLAPLILGFAGAELAAPGGEAAMRAEGERMLAAVPLGCSGLVLLAGLALGAALALAGRCLMTARRRGFCRAVAACSLLFAPFGTALGAYTLATLARPEVAALFDRD